MQLELMIFPHAAAVGNAAGFQPLRVRDDPHFAAIVEPITVILSF